MVKRWNSCSGVAVELAFPGMKKVAWSYGRAICSTPTQKVQGPPGTMKTIAEYQPFANCYGMSINEFELLVLFQSDCQIQS